MPTRALCAQWCSALSSGGECGCCRAPCTRPHLMAARACQVMGLLLVLSTAWPCWLSALLVPTHACSVPHKLHCPPKSPSFFVICVSPLQWTLCDWRQPLLGLGMRLPVLAARMMIAAPAPLLGCSWPPRPAARATTACGWWISKQGTVGCWSPTRSCCKALCKAAGEPGVSTGLCFRCQPFGAIVWPSQCPPSQRSARRVLQVWRREGSGDRSAICRAPS